MIQPVEKPTMDELLPLGYTDYRTDSKTTGLKSQSSSLHKVAQWKSIEDHKGWYETTDDFILITLCNLPYGGIEQKLAPHVQIHEGAIDLLIIRSPISFI